MDRLMRMMYSAAWPLLLLAPRAQEAPCSCRTRVSPKRRSRTSISLPWPRPVHAHKRDPLEPVCESQRVLLSAFGSFGRPCTGSQSCEWTAPTAGHWGGEIMRKPGESNILWALGEIDFTTSVLVSGIVRVFRLGT